jgi:hypothetical protein
MSTVANIIYKALDYQKTGTMMGRESILYLQGKIETMNNLLSGIEDCERSISLQHENIRQWSAFPSNQLQCRMRIVELEEEKQRKVNAYKQLAREVSI